MSLARRIPFILVAVLALACAGLTAAGCGSDDVSSSTNNKPAQAKADDPKDAAAAEDSAGDGELLVTYEGDMNGNAQLVKGSGLVEETATAINDRIALPSDVTIVFGGDPDGPYYDPEDATIQYPWEFVDETKRLLKESGYTKGEELDGAIIDATRFILSHEAAHALIDQLSLPVLGKEEDAADSFASYLAVDVEDDGEGVIAASDLFGAYQDEADAEQKRDGGEPDESAFFDSHSLDGQRFYTISCHVYGADTKRYASVVDGLDIDKDRLEECPAEYEQLSTSWSTVLKPHTRDDT